MIDRVDSRRNPQLFQRGGASRTRDLASQIENSPPPLQQKAREDVLWAKKQTVNADQSDVNIYSEMLNRSVAVVGHRPDGTRALAVQFPHIQSKVLETRIKATRIAEGVYGRYLKWAVWQDHLTEQEAAFNLLYIGPDTNLSPLPRGGREHGSRLETTEETKGKRAETSQVTVSRMDGAISSRSRKLLMAGGVVLTTVAACTGPEAITSESRPTPPSPKEVSADMPFLSRQIAEEAIKSWDGAQIRLATGSPITFDQVGSVDFRTLPDGDKIPDNDPLETLNPMHPDGSVETNMFWGSGEGVYRSGEAGEEVAMKMLIGFNTETKSKRVFGLFLDKEVSNNNHAEYTTAVVQDGEIHSTEWRLIVNQKVEAGKIESSIELFNTDTGERVHLITPPKNEGEKASPTDVPQSFADELITFLTGAEAAQAAELDPTAIPTQVPTPTSEPTPEPTPTVREQYPQWDSIVPEEWELQRVTDEDGLELLAVTTDDGGEVFRVLPDIEPDEEGKFPAWIQVDGEREGVVISKEGLNEEELIATSSDEESTTKWSFDHENGDWEKLLSSVQEIAMQLEYTEDECGEGCKIVNTIEGNDFFRELKSEERGVMGYTNTEGNWVSTKGWQEAMAEKIGPDWESFYFRSLIVYEHLMNLVTDGEVLRDPFKIKTKEGETLATSEVSVRGFYLDSEGKLQSVIFPQLIKFNDDRLYLIRQRKTVDWSEEDIEEIISSDPMTFNIGRKGIVGLPLLMPDMSKVPIYGGQIREDTMHHISLLDTYNDSWDEELQVFYESGVHNNGILFPSGMAFGSPFGTLHLP